MGIASRACSLSAMEEATAMDAGRLEAPAAAAAVPTASHATYVAITVVAACRGSWAASATLVMVVMVWTLGNIPRQVPCCVVAVYSACSAACSCCSLCCIPSCLPSTQDSLWHTSSWAFVLWSIRVWSLSSTCCWQLYRPLRVVSQPTGSVPGRHGPLPLAPAVGTVPSCRVLMLLLVQVVTRGAVYSLAWVAERPILHPSAS